MSIDINEHYSFDSYYRRERDYTYSNRHSFWMKWVAIFVVALLSSAVLFLIGLAIYLFFWKSYIWPGFMAILGTTMVFFPTYWVTGSFRKIMKHEASYQLHERGFTQIIKNRRTSEKQELFIPFEKMESVTMGRYLHVVKARKHGPNTYWISVEFAIKGFTDDGILVVKRFPLREEREIQLWMNRFEKKGISIFYTECLLKDLTVEGYEELNKQLYSPESKDFPLAYQTQKPPINWDGKVLWG